MNAEQQTGIRLDPKQTARLYQALTDQERQALHRWRAEWVVHAGEHSLGDWPGWPAVLARLGAMPRALDRSAR